jgi:hypothetical protein
MQFHPVQYLPKLNCVSIKIPGKRKLFHSSFSTVSALILIQEEHKNVPPSPSTLLFIALASQQAKHCLEEVSRRDSGRKIGKVIIKLVVIISLSSRRRNKRRRKVERTFFPLLSLSSLSIFACAFPWFLSAREARGGERQFSLLHTRCLLLLLSPTFAGKNNNFRFLVCSAFFLFRHDQKEEKKEIRRRKKKSKRSAEEREIDMFEARNVNGIK